MLQWSQSHFLQALGWATLNSFWQMAVLWYLFAAASRMFHPSASTKHSMAISALLLGFVWASVTGFLYYQNDSAAYAFFQATLPQSNNLFNVCLLSASVTYLSLLFFPALRLYRSWRFVRTLKTEGTQKAPLAQRLFVQRIAFHLGIAKKVKLVVSNLVSSPLTIGYVKPMILLPVAVFNNLSTAQAEAVLLHELSHIRRYDYLLNFVVSIVHTLLYFNPFVRFFVNAVESERETCCDEAVLQFGYDKLSYASALLQLEKSSGSHKALALAATGRHNLLHRIEKIVGMEKKRPIRLVQIVPLFFALLCLLLLNSVLLVKDTGRGTAISYNADAVFMPWQFEPTGNGKKKELLDLNEPKPQPAAVAKASTQIKIDIFNSQSLSNAESVLPAASPVENILPVNFDDIDGRLTTEAKEDVKTTVEATRRVVGQLKWKEIETSLADVMNKREKAIVRQECFSQIDNLNWQNVEQNLKANYEHLNWQAIQENVKMATAIVRYDSLETVYNTALQELQKAEKDVRILARVKTSPLPDCSLDQLSLAKETLRKNLDSLKASKPKKVVHL